MNGFGESAALILGLAAVGFSLTWLTGRGGYFDPRGRFSLSFNPQALLMAALFLGFALYMYGIVGGIAVAGSIMWHEWGHVIAYRVAGHHDARFRLIPLFGGVAISDRLPTNQAASCFISLMGPGFSVSLTVMLALAAEWSYQNDLPFTDALDTAAMLCAGINAFNMLPLWPLDGGRALQLIVFAGSPRLAAGLTTAMSALLAGLAIVKQMWLLLMFAVIGFQSAQRGGNPELMLRPMTGGQAATAAAAYLTILGAHLAIGMPLVRWILHL